MKSNSKIVYVVAEDDTERPDFSSCVHLQLVQHKVIILISDTTLAKSTIQHNKKRFMNLIKNRRGHTTLQGSFINRSGTMFNTEMYSNSSW